MEYKTIETYIKRVLEYQKNLNKSSFRILRFIYYNQKTKKTIIGFNLVNFRGIQFACSFSIGIIGGRLIVQAISLSSFP